MSSEYSEAVSTARDYYNSDDADNFYFIIWGGEDIHIGLYVPTSESTGETTSETTGETTDDSTDQSIHTASRRTVERMASLPRSIGGDSQVLDIGAGYGGAARYLAQRFGCRVTALNLSEVENERNRKLSREQGLDDLIEVIDGNFESLPFEDASFDLVWSQDAFLHSGRRERVFSEAVRVMKPRAELVFTDPMQTDNCPPGVLQPILDRIHLETLGSPSFYRAMADRYGLREVSFDELTPHLATHYARVLAETEARQNDLRGQVSQEYLERMKRGLQHWVDGGRRGYLSWGIFYFQRD